MRRPLRKIQSRLLEFIGELQHPPRNLRPRIARSWRFLGFRRTFRPGGAFGSAPARSLAIGGKSRKQGEHYRQQGDAARICAFSHIAALIPEKHL
jgi:hypothetical protein